jgi:hypothetical protein
MGRSSGGYSGGSTITFPGHWSARSDAGPPIALDRARRENIRIRAAQAAIDDGRKNACEEADRKIHSANHAVEEFKRFVAFLYKCWYRDEEYSHLEFDYLIRHSSLEKQIDDFLNSEIASLFTLGPKYKRIARDLHYLLCNLKRAGDYYIASHSDGPGMGLNGSYVVWLHRQLR